MSSNITNTFAPKNRYIYIYRYWKVKLETFGKVGENIFTLMGVSQNVINFGNLEISFMPCKNDYNIKY